MVGEELFVHHRPVEAEAASLEKRWNKWEGRQGGREEGGDAGGMKLGEADGCIKMCILWMGSYVEKHTRRIELMGFLVVQGSQ